MKALYLLLVPASAFLVPQWGCRRPLFLLRAAAPASDDDKEDILDLYKTVAEQDPEWYQEFIANVLQEDVLLELSASDESSATTKVNGDSSSNMSIFSSEPGSEEETKDQKVVPVEAVKVDIEEEVIVDVLIEEEEEVPDNQLSGAAIEENPDSGKDRAAEVDLTDGPDIEDTPDSGTDGAAEVDPTGVDLQLKTDEKKAQDEDLYTGFGYKEEGYASEVQEVMSEDVNDEQNDEALQLEEHTMAMSGDELIEGEDVILSNEEIDIMVESTMQQAEKEIEEAPTVVQEYPPIVVVNSTASSESAAVDDSYSNSDAPPPTVVVYRDLYTGSLLAAPLRVLTKLGYTMDEVSFLQPDALSLILEDNIAKPRRGVPQQWKVSPSQKNILDDVKVVTKEQARDMLAAAKAKKPSPPPPIVEEEEDLEEEELPKRTRRQRPTAASPDSEVRQRVRRDDGDRQREPRSSRQAQEQRSKAPRNQKPAPANDPRGDPPMPVNPVWVDIDTFRDLLRKEAELRVRILGDGWKDTVKKESKWRLDLYKEWLWSLSEGVGDPIVVESRVPPSQRRAREIPTPPRRRDPSASRREEAPSRQRRQRRSAPPSGRSTERRIMDPRNPSRSRPSRRSEGPPPRPTARPQRRRLVEEDDEYYYD